MNIIDTINKQQKDLRSNPLWFPCVQSDWDSIRKMELQRERVKKAGVVLATVGLGAAYALIFYFQV